MMNLVQLQERLKDVPMQALMQYANGSNPQIPPFIALGELNRRKKMQESAAADQAQEMEGAPTVKQQIEQAAGLMALQGNRQKQAAQQQQAVQAKAPMAAPNTTTSEPAQLAGGGFIDDIVVPRDFQSGGMARGMNPDMLKKLMMMQAMKKRRQGLGQLANNMRRADYAGGGIVAFQNGGAASSIGPAPYEVDLEEMSPEERKRYFAEKMKAREQTMGETRSARPQPTSIDELPKRTYASPAAAKMGIGSILSRTGKALGPLGLIAHELLFTSPEDLEKLRAADARKLREKEGLPQASYSNEGRNYTDGRSREFKRIETGPDAEDKGLGSLAPAASEPRMPTAPKSTPEIDFLRKIYNQADPDYMAQLKAAGLDKRPSANKLMEELARQKKDVEGEDTFTNRLMSLTPGRRFGTGELGKGLMAFEKGQKDKLRSLGREIAAAEDLEAKADYEFRRGNFDAATRLKAESQKLKTDAAKSAGQMGINLEEIAARDRATQAQVGATAEARRGTNLTGIENARYRAIAQATKSLDEQINAIAGLSALGQALTAPQKAQLEALRKERDAIVASINSKFDRMAAQQGGVDAGGFKVIGVKPGAK